VTIIKSAGVVMGVAVGACGGDGQQPHQQSVQRTGSTQKVNLEIGKSRYQW